MTNEEETYRIWRTFWYRRMAYWELGRLPIRPEWQKVEE